MPVSHMYKQDCVQWFRYLIIFAIQKPYLRSPVNINLYIKYGLLINELINYTVLYTETHKYNYIQTYAQDPDE